MTPLTLHLLGAPCVIYGGERLTFRSRKALGLLIYLAVEPGLHARDHLATLLWPDADQAHCRMLLRSAIALLRQSLGQVGLDSEQVIVIGQDQVGLHGTAIDLDLAVLDKAEQPLERTLGVNLDAIQADHYAGLQDAIKLYRGNFLCGFTIDDAPLFDEWATVQRERNHRRMHPIFDQLSEFHRCHNAWDAAIDVATHWVAHDPLHEAAHQRLIALHSAAGNRTAALSAYKYCCTVFKEELGIAPSAETTALVEQLHASAVPKAVVPARVPVVTDLQHEQRSHATISHRYTSDTWQRIRGAYQSAQQGKGQVLVLEQHSAQPHHGLAAELTDWAAANGADLLYGRAYDLGGRVPYQSVGDALRQRLDQERAPDDLLSDIWLSELSRLVPDLRERYPDLPLPLADNDTDTMRLHEAVVRLTSALARRRPLIWLVDQVHLADSASLDLLHYVARRWAADQTPVLLLYTLETPHTGRASSQNRAITQWISRLGRDLPVTFLKQQPTLVEVIRRNYQAFAA